MLSHNSCDFSFSGLKTAALYALKDISLEEKVKKEVALEFENAISDVLFAKTERAVQESGARTLVLGGGVSANTHIRRMFTKRFETEYPDVSLRIPHASLTTDNAVMIALAGYYRALQNEYQEEITANGNLSLSSTKNP